MLNIKSSFFTQSKEKYLIILLIITLSSCASRSINFRGNQFSTSETKGAFGTMSFAGAFAGAQKVEMSTELTPENTSQNIDFSTGNSDQSRMLDFLMAMGLLPLVDFEFQFAYDAPMTGGLKIQLFGDHESEASAGSFSIAGRFGFGFLSNMVNEGSYKYNLDGTVSHFEIICGMRVMSNLLVYTGGFLRPYDVGIEYYEGSDQRKFGSGKQQGMHAGIKYDLEKTFIKFNVAQVRNIYSTNNVSREDLLFGLNIGHTY